MSKFAGFHLVISNFIGKVSDIRGNNVFNHFILQILTNANSIMRIPGHELVCYGQAGKKIQAENIFMQLYMTFDKRANEKICIILN